MTEVSTPACRSCMAAVCLSVRAEICFVRKVGHSSAAAATYFAMRSSRASRLSRPPSRAPKSGSFGMTRALPEPDAQHGHRASGQWGDTVLTALASTADVRSIAEVNIATQETGELGSPQAGLDGKEK